MLILVVRLSEKFRKECSLGKEASERLRELIGKMFFDTILKTFVVNFRKILSCFRISLGKGRNLTEFFRK